MRMGLDKDAASARISRYEGQAMTISLEALFELAEALEVPPAYLLATTPAMAAAILALGQQTEPQQQRWAEAMAAMNELPVGKRKAAVEALLASVKQA